MFASTIKVNAQEQVLTYSDWSTYYPSGLDAVFIESEVRYKWYKVENNLINYTDEYYVSLDGYIKDEASATTFYRYITNTFLYFTANNELAEYNYCKKNFCYVKYFNEPTLVDMSGKDTQESKYETAEIYRVNSEVSPMTGDVVIYSFIIFFISLATIIFIVVKKRRKMSNE